MKIIHNILLYHLTKFCVIQPNNLENIEGGGDTDPLQPPRDTSVEKAQG